MIDLIKKFLSANGNDGSGLCDYITSIMTDRRYKAKLLAGSCGWTSDGKSIIPSGIISYRNIKYYFFIVSVYIY